MTKYELIPHVCELAPTMSAVVNIRPIVAYSAVKQLQLLAAAAATHSKLLDNDDDL